MINLETSQFAGILGGKELQHRATHPVIAVLFAINSYPLTVDEVATQFTMLAPTEARVDESLRNTLSAMESKGNPRTEQVALIRWRDGTESLVGFSAADTVPPTALLQSAYCNGYGVRRLKASLAKDAEDRRHD